MSMRITAWLGGIALAMSSYSHAIVLGDVEQSAGSRVTVNASLAAEFPVCGGTILNEHWILTAAHCVVDGTGTEASNYAVARPGGLSVTINSKDRLNYEQEDLYMVSHVIVHPDYTRYMTFDTDVQGSYRLISTALEADVALLRLENAIQSPVVVELATPGDMLEIEPRLISQWLDSRVSNYKPANVTVYGWGATTPQGDSASPILLSTTNAYYPVKACFLRLEAGKDIPELIDSKLNQTKICVLPNKSEILDFENMTSYGNGACFGDSGGPLIDDVSGMQIGIVSGSPIVLPSCGSLTQPTVYSKVSTYYDWIMSYANEPAPSKVISEPNFIKYGDGNGIGANGNCSTNAISTTNCNFRKPVEGGTVPVYVLLSLFGLGLYRRIRK